MDGIIRLDDGTSHGGRVISSQPTLTVDGVEVACVGDMVYCPLCKGVFPIADASHAITYKGKKIAVAGMKSECGAVLLASQVRARC